MSQSAPPQSGMDAGTVKLAQELLDAIPSQLRFDEPPEETYDALADLFLCDAPSPSITHPPSEPVNPAPAGLQVEAAEAPAPTLRIDDALDSGSASAVQAPIEALILGHLPVLASVWVMQYAKSLAQEQLAPVALLRFSQDHVTLDIVGDEEQARECVDTHATLQSAIQSAGKLAGTWLIRLAETDEPAVFDQENIDTVTLLTGADEAAIVASYRTVKSIASNWNPDQPGPVPNLKLSVMGATPEKSRDAWTRLNRATKTFLEREVELGLCPDRVSAGKSRTVYSGDSDEELATVLEWVHGASAAGHLVPMIPTHTPPPPPPPSLDPIVHPAPTHVAPEPAPVHFEPTTPPAQHESVAKTRDDLAAKIGLNSIAARCPYAEHVELALDHDGKLHIMAAATHTSHANEQAALHALTLVAAWAADHAQMIAMTCQDASASVECVPVLHLLTDRPQNVRRLLDADIRIHLLAPVDPNQDWYCTALN